MQDAVPRLDPFLTPPWLHGTAALAHRAFARPGLDALLRFAARPAGDPGALAALLLDCAAAHRLHFRAREADALQAQALARACLFRVAPGEAATARPLRVLALMAPGDLMVNTPLDFLTTHLDVRLDLLFVRPGEPLPDAVPDHDVAFFAVSESDPATLARLAPLFRSWPRPALNDPARAALLTRDGVARAVAGLPGCAAPQITPLARTDLRAEALSFPLLLRPHGSHAGDDLARLDGGEDLARYLASVPDAQFYACPFIDYRGADGQFRKYRIAFVAGAPFLCHMAVSSHWMVHYLNAGMTESAAKRDEEAAAMAAFDTGFARRHDGALAALAGHFALDYVQIDCAELPDGRLLVFEADVAAIVHMMDPPDLFPYKPPQMRRVIAATSASNTSRRPSGSSAQSICT